VSTLALTAVGGTWWETGVALAANHLVAVVLGGKGLERWLNDTTTETEDQMEGGLLLNVVVGKSTACIFPSARIPAPQPLNPGDVPSSSCLPAKIKRC
jgi:hypothetical protein